MKRLITIALLCAASLVHARTWEEAFDEAVESKNRRECESTYERMLSNSCALAGIYRGGQNMGAVRSCEYQAKAMRNACIGSIKENAEAAAEAEIEKRAEMARNQQAAQDAISRKAELAELAAISKARPADIDVSCTRTSAVRTKSGNYTYDPITFFDQIVVLQIYNGGACYGTLGSFLCSITPSTIVGYSHNKGSVALNRITGIMSISGKYDMEATYSCQKATPLNTKI